MSCVPTVLAAWEPDAAGSAEVLRPWPWETTFFGDADALRAGASGLDCDRAYFSYDQLYAGPGDGDGFADVVDCDNEDAAARPRLPALDGWATPECDSPDDDCYVCPSAGDDDDSASGGDDDDAGDDDRAEGPSAGPPPPDANADARQVDPGCVNACGYSWTPRFTLLLFILPFAARRPYSPRSHHSVSSTRPGR